jgi:hypothetical protein
MTASADLTRPPFLYDTFNDRGDGFLFSSDPPSDIADPKNLVSDDEWTVMACALARLKVGDFAVFPHVLNALERTDDADFWNATALLYSFAAPLNGVSKLTRVFPAGVLRESSTLVVLYSETLLHSMSVSFIDPVLELYHATRDEDVRVAVADYLSHLLEDEPGPVAAGPVRKLDPQYPPEFADHYRDYDEYLVTVRRIRDEVVADAGSDLVPILGGKPFHVATLARRIIKHAQAGEDLLRTNFERMAFEANTGISCREFFTPGDHPKLRPLVATAIAEDFLRSGTADAYQPGIRYFFGRPIPP